MFVGSRGPSAATGSPLDPSRDEEIPGGLAEGKAA